MKPTIQSMTGYGQGDCEVTGVQFHTEIRSVNHRFLEMTIRMPAGWGVMEEEVKSVLRRHLKRGKVNVVLTVEGEPASRRELDVDWELADHLMQAARLLQERYGFTHSITLADLLHHPHVLQMAEARVQPEEFRQPLLEMVESAVQSLLTMRKKEGESLADDLLIRLENLEQLTQAMKERVPYVVTHYRERLQERLSEFLDTAVLDQDRILAEAAVFAERADIAEELTRLNSHLSQFRESIHRRDAVGRRLDFLIQEMNREVNTIGSKAHDAQIGSLVVECKSELEKMREQVQNIE
ncbi:YicC/YloC family endoribonuclease [Desmospora activa]|uniref:Uncharacterized protein (TIGR00255 family) n=1 Tax=Desmospora activa DSM 45169 TaxID=1121389 RepID=A0A2T4ZB67_9BACL|nr:YicC/YloC family endoribonuclease [Desmospora activa]PTM59143.1 uncharacterized protein (TIGR00255 family) [Desmospora activa DSM 45169]